jgi:hypothetical protein
VLKEILAKNPDVTRKLRALWTLHVTKGLTEKDLVALLANPSEYIRSWAIQLLAEGKSISPETLKRFGTMAKTDASALVRLYLASAMQRIDPSQRWGVVEALSQKAVDKTDHNLPQMVWYAAEPLATLDAKRFVQMGEKAKLPKFLNYTIQRTGSLNTTEAKGLLKDLDIRLGKVPTKENQDNQALIAKVLAPAPTQDAHAGHGSH